MPDQPPQKLRPHPWKSAGPLPIVRGPGSGRRAAYAELGALSNFSFLEGASHPDELVRRAAELEHGALALADRHTLAGAVRAHVAAREQGLPLALGSRVELGAPAGPRAAGEASGAVELELYAESRAGWANLCRLLTEGRRGVPKGEFRLSLERALELSGGLLAVLRPPEALDAGTVERLRALRGAFGRERLSLAARAGVGPLDRERLAALARLAREEGLELAASNDVRYHAPARRMLQDVLTCVRHGCTLDRAGFRLFANAERHLKPPAEMRALFAGHERALARGLDLALRASAFSLSELSYEYPDEVVPAGSTPMRHLGELVELGARERFPRGVPAKVRSILAHELALIEELDYARFFLTVQDLVAFARRQGILCQGRGAAANSATCYCLGITSVDPDRIDVLFERFVSRERDEPPDIDVDFEHERREEVIQYVYAKYGRERAAIAAEVITYRGRSAVRDVGKALGLSLDLVDRLAKRLDHWGEEAAGDAALRELGLDPADPTLGWLVRLSNELLGFPRHLSQHVGGFVISRPPLCELVPIVNAAMPERTVIEWDKDDIDALGLLKVDVLGLGMLTCLRKCFELVRGQGGPALDLASLPSEDPAVYDDVCRADTVGVFQIESRAQMAMLPRLRPRSYYDLVIEVSIVRPGPIVGGMVHPYLRRRQGKERAVYESPEVEQVLGKTLGVPLFQEQAMRLAVLCAGFTPGEAEGLRRTIAAWRSKGDLVREFGERFLAGMAARGYSADFAERCLEQMKGFSHYGFPESHAASFAHLVYASAWLKHHHPAAFAAALLNSQPMGFYAPAQIVRDAREHGVPVRPVNVGASRWDCTLEDSFSYGSRNGTKTTALRLGMRMVKGLEHAQAERVERARARGPFASIEALWRASGAKVAALRALARADAFRSMGVERRPALWSLGKLRDEELPLFPAAEEAEAAASLPPLGAEGGVVADYRSTGLSLAAHPVSFLRERLARMGACCAAELVNAARWPAGARVAVAGIVLCRQRPSTASGVLFVTLEDETGTANLIVRPDAYERSKAALRTSSGLLVRGRVEREGAVVHVQVARAQCLDRLVRKLETRSRDFH